MRNYALTPDFAMPAQPKPIMVIGAGGIVEEAHLPAYRKAGWFIQGIYDVHAERAAKVATAFGINNVYGSMQELIAHASAHTVFDIAVRLRPSKPLREVFLQRSGVAADFRQAGGGWVEVKIPVLRDFEMVVCTY